MKLNALTKAEWIAKADAICRQGNQQINQAAHQQFGNQKPTAAEVQQFTANSLTPNVQSQVDQIKDAMEQSLAPGCQTFEQALFTLYKQNVISLDEALQNADSSTNLSWLINNAKVTETSKVQQSLPTADNDLSSIRLNL